MRYGVPYRIFAHIERFYYGTEIQTLGKLGY